MPILSVGHSTLPAEKFGDQLRSFGVTQLWDIRSHPTSKWPQFWGENMESWLPNNYGISYIWEPRLGGWDVRHAVDPFLNARMAANGVDLNAYSKGKFPKQRIAPDRSDISNDIIAWTNQGLYDYSWFTTLDEYQEGIDALIHRAEKETVAIMCCEALWWKCHRSMVADTLVWRGYDVIHIPFNKSHTASLGNRLERYDRRIIEAWQAGVK